MLIRNSVFLVTGGASDDYGRATVEKLLKEGGRVIICDLPTKDLNIYGDDKAIFLPINVNNENDIKTLLAVIEDKYGKLDGVINCIDHHKLVPVCDYKEKEPHDLKEFTDIVYENILGPFNVIRFTIPLMARNIPKKASGRGIIINMSNAAAFDGAVGSCAYSASKAAVISMTETLSFELQGIQIRCVSIVANTRSQSSGVTSFFSNPSDSITEEPVKFAELVKTVIETPGMNTPMLRLEIGSGE